MIRVIKRPHDTTSYTVRGKEGVSGEWLPESGLREGCSTSPVRFKIHHQAVMRQEEEHRRELGGEGVGVRFGWVSGGSFSGTKTWEMGSSEATTMAVSSLLFSDDTTIVGRRGELGEGVGAVKEVMGKW